MEIREFLKRLFGNPEGTEEFILEHRSHKKSFYLCLITGFLIIWNTFIMQFVGEHYTPFFLAALMYLSIIGAAELTLKILPAKLRENKTLKIIIIAIEVVAIAFIFNWIVIIYKVPFLYFLISELGALVIGELYLMYKETFFDFFWVAYRKTEHNEQRGYLSRITSWYVLITGLIFQLIFFPLASFFMVWAQRGVGILLYSFLFILWWVWSSALCTYILDKKIKDNHLKNSIIAWGSNIIGIGHLIIISQLVFIIIQ
ncbi:MAG TPA: hypothetical protein VMV49_18520 [Candidatus Deferrimicrobium sp.]|nr:hypothetical protein [Candidatus Deferrimicrobium sp.]